MRKSFLKPLSPVLNRSVSAYRKGIGFLFALALFAPSCAQISDKSASAIVKGCVLPSDQSGTLSGKWRTAPVPIAFHEGDFSDAEKAEIVTAANTWNDFFSKSLGFPTIDYGSASNPRTAQSTHPAINNLCANTVLTGSTFNSPIIIYKNTTWLFPSQPTAMAITTYCRTAASPLPNYTMAVMDLNYQYFFVSGRRVPDLQSIVLHEFGHLLGVNHSCAGSATSGFPNCADGNSDYINAVMYPTFGWDSQGRGEQRRTLKSNDQGRANCLYE